MNPTPPQNTELDDSTLLTNGNGVHRELLFKILVIGDYGVGKTAIVRRYTEGKFSSNYKITIGADFSIKSLQWDDYTKINLQLWDIAGHERFGYMTRVYYKYAPASSAVIRDCGIRLSPLPLGTGAPGHLDFYGVAAAIVFDVSRIATFQSVAKWLNDLREKVTLHDGTPVPVVLLANKCDIQGTTIPSDTIKNFCNANGVAGWFVTSAKENINIEEAMTFLVDKVIHFKAREASSDSIILQDYKKNEGKNIKTSCCG